jgi:hypothetical protein
MAGVLWVLLSYRLPREPSRLRLAIWRRLKRLGSIVLHDAVWLLPSNPKNREGFEWLAEEIEEQGGTAFVWEATSLGSAQDHSIIAQFRLEADQRYAAIAESAASLGSLATRRRPANRSRLEQARRQLAGLDRALRLEARRDHFRAPGRRAAEKTVQAATRTLAEPPGTALSARPRVGGKVDAVGH